MLTGTGGERDSVVTPSRECDGVMAECRVLLCYQPIALRNR
jgi:hypothetical protein